MKISYVILFLSIALGVILDLSLPKLPFWFIPVMAVMLGGFAASYYRILAEKW
jgi:hypothetical protein